MTNKALRELNDIMTQAASYEEYKEAAQTHDKLSGAEEWKAKDGGSSTC